MSSSPPNNLAGLINEATLEGDSFSKEEFCTGEDPTSTSNGESCNSEEENPLTENGKSDRE